MDAIQFFTVDEVARMLRVSAGFIRVELRSGRFFPVEQGEIDTRTVIRIAGEDRVSMVGLSWYLRGCVWPCQAHAVGELLRTLTEVVDVPPAEGVLARSEGELRRKVARGKA